MARVAERLNIALGFAARGVRIIPQTRGKTPPVGFKDPAGKASTDPEVIRKWAREYPDCNWAALAGKVSGFVALDSDIKHEGQNGEHTLAALEKQYAVLPITLTVRTGSGGRHRYFVYPDGVEELPHKTELGPGLELLADKHFVTLPGSSYADGREYVLLQDGEMARCPSWLLESIQALSTRKEAKKERKNFGEKYENGQRNDALCSLAGFLRAKGMDFDQLVEALLKWNVEHCEPPESAERIREIARWAGEKASGLDDLLGEGRQADELVKLAEDVELFHWKDEGYGSVPVKQHSETLLLKGRTFALWLRHRYYKQEGRTPGIAPMTTAVATLQGKALFDAEEKPVYVRVAGDNSRIFIDMGDPSWQVIEVDAGGWRITEDSPVKFRRPAGIAALPVPVSGGDLLALHSLLNIENDDDFILVTAWLLQAINPIGPYPILSLHGEQGAAKSTTARILKSILDPNVSPLRASPRNNEDLMIAANNSWCLCFDNLSSLTDWFSDSLCRLATGGGLSKRTLYADEEETILDAKRPVVINGIEDLGTKGDILDRSLIAYLPRIDEKERLTEADIGAWFKEEWPKLLGGLLDVAVVAIRNLPNLVVPELPRMADFAKWVIAAEPALPWEPGRFLAAYNSNRLAVNELALEAAPISEEIRNLVDKQCSGSWEGTATELLAELENGCGDKIRHKWWPASPQGLSGMLWRLSPTLRKVGISVERGRTSKGRGIILAKE
jgi:hypothetical protein